MDKKTAFRFKMDKIIHPSVKSVVYDILVTIHS